MSTEGKRDFRPAIHFTPEKMWINDPNGMVYVDGKWHLFYQYYPEDTVWGPMHWGHAVSEDLTEWKQLPTALYPDELGYIFSGSCVCDAENSSGFKKDGKPPMVALYTSHGETEQQSLAYSTDYIHFEKYAGNPVLSNPGLPDFRDPKVFWNSIKGCWGMVLAAGDRVHFYCSPDLKNWDKTGEFKHQGSWSEGGVWECPDLFPLEWAGGVKWVLLVSINTPEEVRGSSVYYFIGQFDGDSFSCTETDMPLLLDEGFDHYAGVTFQNSADRIEMSWAVNWLYAAKQPTGVYCGQMSLARRLSLAGTQAGARVAGTPVLGKKFDHCCAEVQAGRTASVLKLPGETFHIRVTGEKDACIVLRNKEGQELRIELSEDILTVDRSRAGDTSFDSVFASDRYSKVSARRKVSGKYVLELYWDVSIMELFADQGLTAITLLAFPDSPFTEAEAVDCGLTLYC